MRDPPDVTRVPTDLLPQWRSATTGYAEQHCKTNFFFLEGVCHADELVAQASVFGYEALALTDRNTSAGVVRAAFIDPASCCYRYLI